MSISIFNKTKTFFDETKKQSIDVKSVFKKCTLVRAAIVKVWIRC